MTAVIASGLWGLALLGSFIGWGRLVAACLRVRARAHLGLELVWGFAATLAAGGYLCALGLATRPVLGSLVALGLAGLALRRERAPSARSEAPLALRASLAVLALLLLGLGYVTGLLDPRYQAPDDHGAYFLHARQIVETGTLSEPFGFRRLASSGGQSFLHALVLVVAPVGQLNLLDKGLCRLGFTIALLASFLARPQRSLAAAAVVVYLAVAYHDVAYNTSSIFSGALAFTGLMTTLELCRREPGRPVANGILTGLAIGATLPLRQNYLLASALMVGLAHTNRLRHARDTRQASELAVAAVAAGLAFGGWALLQWRSLGTPLFPLLPGFANPEWIGVFSARSLGELSLLVASVRDWPVLPTAVALTALSLTIPDRAERSRGLDPFASAALLAFAIQCWPLAHVHPGLDLLRYTASFLLPPLFFAAGRAAETLTERRGPAVLRHRRAWGAAALLLLLLWHLPPWTHLPERMRLLSAEVAAAPRVPRYEARARSLARLQSAAPPAQKLLVMLDDPYLLDLRRNEVSSLDLPGGVSPPPGLASLDNPRAVVEYLRGLGYAWLAAARPDRASHSSTYRLERWRAHRDGVRQPWQYDPGSVRAWQIMGGTVMRFLDQLEVITASCRLTYDDAREVMIDLSQCRFADRGLSPP